MMTDLARAAMFDVLGSETRYEGSIFSVRVDEVVMPGGGTARRDVVDHLRAVAVAALDSAGRLVLIDQYRHPLRRRLWELPAGLMDIDGEGPLAAAQRELAEETSLAAGTWSVLVDLATSPGFCTETIRVYLASDLTDVSAPERVEEEADLRVVRVPLADAVAGVMDGRIVNATAVAGILAAAHATAAGAAPLRPATGTWADGPATVGHGEILPAPALGTSRS